MAPAFQSSDTGSPPAVGRTAREICEVLQSAKIAVELMGDPQARATEIADSVFALPNSLIFVERPRDVHLSVKTPASIVLIPIQEMSDLVPASVRAFLGVPDVRKAMPALLSLFDRRPAPSSGVHSTAVVAKNAALGKNVFLGP